MSPSFGVTLRVLRHAAGFSLRGMAERIGVSSAYLSRVENGHDPAPTSERLIAIAEVLGLPHALLIELARQTGPAIDGYLMRVPAASALLLGIARRGLGEAEIAQVEAFIDQEFPAAQAGSPPDRQRAAGRSRRTAARRSTSPAISIPCRRPAT